MFSVQKSHTRSFIDCEQPGDMARDEAPLVVCLWSSACSMFYLPGLHACSDSRIWNQSDSSLWQWSGARSQSSSDKELGDQLFPISSEPRAGGNGFKLREGLGLFMAEFLDAEGCSTLGLDYRERLENSCWWRWWKHVLVCDITTGAVLQLCSVSALSLSTQMAHVNHPNRLGTGRLECKKGKKRSHWTCHSIIHSAALWSQAFVFYIKVDKHKLADA